jgi:hypothetical protein
VGLKDLVISEFNDLVIVSKTPFLNRKITKSKNSQIIILISGIFLNREKFQIAAQAKKEHDDRGKKSSYRSLAIW